jgi:hypothetical protein
VDSEQALNDPAVQLLTTIMEHNRRDAEWVNDILQGGLEKDIQEVVEMFVSLYKDIASIPYELRSARLQDIISGHYWDLERVQDILAHTFKMKEIRNGDD